jgi:hypothetical protein
MTSQESGGGPSALPPPGELEGMEVRDPAGAPVARVEEVYVDRDAGIVRYVAVEAEAPDEVHLVPASIVQVEETWLIVACDSDALRGGPTVGRDATVMLADEEQAVAYFRDLHGAGYMRPWAEPPEIHAAGYMRPEREPPEVHGAGYMRPGDEPPEVHGAGHMRPEDEPPEVHGAGYMRPGDEPPQSGAAGRMDPALLSTVKRWRE